MEELEWRGSRCFFPRVAWITSWRTRSAPGGREFHPPDLADSALRGLAGRDLTDGVLRPRIDPVLAMLVAENPSGVGGAEGGGAEERDREWGGGSVGSDVVGMQLPWDCAMGDGLLQNVAGDASVVGAPTVARASAFWGCNMVCTYCWRQSDASIQYFS